MTRIGLRQIRRPNIAGASLSTEVKNKTPETPQMDNAGPAPAKPETNRRQTEDKPRTKQR